MKTEASEYLSLLQEIQNNNVSTFTVMPADEPRFTIETNSRNIIVPSEFSFLSVQNDHRAETIYFEIDRYFDNVDLSQHTCVVQFINKSGTTINEGTYPVTSMDIDSVDGKIVFGWEIRNDATQLTGDITFSVRFYSIDNNGNFTYNFNTLTASSYILPSLNIIASGERITATELEVWTDKMNNLASSIESDIITVEEKIEELENYIASIPEDYTALTEEVSQLSSEIEGLTYLHNDSFSVEAIEKHGLLSRYKLEFVNGVLKGADGTLLCDNTLFSEGVKAKDAIVSVTFLPRSTEKIISDSGYRFALYAFSDNGEYVGRCDKDGNIVSSMVIYEGEIILGKDIENYNVKIVIYNKTLSLTPKDWIHVYLLGGQVPFNTDDFYRLNFNSASLIFEQGGFSPADGTEVEASNRVRSQVIECVNGFCIKAKEDYLINLFYYDNEGNYITNSYYKYGDWLSEIEENFSGNIRVLVKKGFAELDIIPQEVKPNILSNYIDLDSVVKVADNVNENYYYVPNLLNDSFGAENSFCNQHWTYYEFINNIYQPLKNKYPNYISRKSIGKDASGTYEMYCYVFEPQNYEYTVYLQAGVHGYNERQAYIGLAKMMSMICEEYSQNYYIDLLRKTVRFIVVPVVNPYDVSERTYSPNNSNNVNLNRNWNAENVEQEIANVKSVLAEYGDSIDFAFDLHTDPEGVPGWGGYLIFYPNTVYPWWSNRLKRINNYLYETYLSHIKKGYMGDDLHYPTGSSIDVNTTPNYPTQDISSCCSSGMWTEFNIPSATLEHGDKKFGDRGSAIEMTRCVELFLNHIIEQVKSNIKLERKLYDLENK